MLLAGFSSYFSSSKGCLSTLNAFLDCSLYCLDLNSRTFSFFRLLLLSVIQGLCPFYSHVRHIR